MKECPICHISLDENVFMCPNCHTKFVKENLEILTDIPMTKEQKKQQEAKLELTSTIPFVVKKIKNKFNYHKALAYCLPSFLALVIMCVSLLTISPKSQPVVTFSNSKNYDIYNGTWFTSNGELLKFNIDNSIYYYSSYSNQANYIYGNYKTKQGVDALDDIGYSEEEFKITFPDVEIDNLFTIDANLQFGVNMNKTYTLDSSKKKWWLIFLKRQNGTYEIYNKTTDEIYLIKKGSV